MNSKDINKLIANNIVDIGIKECSEFNYSVDLESYLKNKDSEFIKYINNNLEEIIEEVKQNENVADLQYDNKYKTFDMVFYIDSVLDRVENIIYTNAEMLDIDLDVSDIRSISDEILDDDAFNEDLINKIKYSKGEYEL
jgi:hypothetical protein